MRNYLHSTCPQSKIPVEISPHVISSDAGILLLQEAGKKIGLLESGKFLIDNRRLASCQHTKSNLLLQRLYALALGYEDVNDHQFLAQNILFQRAIGKNINLASPSSLCRFENSITKEDIRHLSSQFIDIFLNSYEKPPEKIILDFDSSDIEVHGKQEGRFYHGYYRHYCFLPLYVFCGNHLLCAYLRPGNTDNSKHVLAILSLLVKRIRQVWKDTRIIFRADSAFCRWRLMQWCDKNNVYYIIGLAKNSRLLNKGKVVFDEVQERYRQTEQNQKEFRLIQYGAKSWDEERDVVMKTEICESKSSTRFLVTNLKDTAKNLYQLYCKRGEMENRIKELHLYLYAKRTSCKKLLANQFRLLLSGLAYTLLQVIREIALKNTEFSSARCDTIRLTFLKISALIIHTYNDIKIIICKSYPYKNTLFYMLDILKNK